MTLPLEIILHIFTALHAIGAYSTLGKCARLCNSLRYICQRLLFSDLEFNFDRWTGYRLAPRIIAIFSSNTQLANFVNSVAIRVLVGDGDPLKPVYDLFDCLAKCPVTTLLLGLYDVSLSKPASFEFKVHRFIASLRPTLRVLRTSNLPFSVHRLPIQSLEELEFDCERSQRPEITFLDYYPEGDVSGLGPLRIGHLMLRLGGPLDIILPDPTITNSIYPPQPSRIDFQSIHTLSVLFQKDLEVDPALLLAKTSNLTDLNITLREPHGVGVEGTLSQLHPNSFKTVKRLDFDGKFEKRHTDIFLGLFDIVPRFTALESLVITISTHPQSWSFQREVWEIPVTVLDPVRFPHLKKVEIEIRACDEVGDGGPWIEKLRSSSFARLREFVPEVDCCVLLWHHGMADKNWKIPDKYVIH